MNSNVTFTFDTHAFIKRLMSVGTINNKDTHIFESHKKLKDSI